MSTTLRPLLFDDVAAAIKFLRRHRDQVIQVIVIVAENGSNGGSWKGAMKTNYGAVVLSGLIILSQES